MELCVSLCFLILDSFLQSNLWRLKILVPLFFTFIAGGALGTLAFLKYARATQRSNEKLQNA